MGQKQSPGTDPRVYGTLIYDGVAAQIRREWRDCSINGKSGHPCCGKKKFNPYPTALTKIGSR